MSHAACTWAWDAEVGSTVERVVLLYLAKCADAANECWPSMRVIAEKTHLCRESVVRALPRLVEAGLISIVPRQHENGGAASHLYTLNRAVDESHTVEPGHGESGSPKPHRSPPKARGVMDESHTSLSLESVTESVSEIARTPSESSPRARAKPPAKIKRPATKRCPVDWEPDDSVIQVAIANGYTEDGMLHELAMMRDHQFRDAHSDWSAVARNWLRRSNVHGSLRGNGSQQHLSFAVQDAMLREAEAKAVKAGFDKLMEERRAERERGRDHGRNNGARLALPGPQAGSC